MIRLIALSVFVAAALGACSTPTPQQQAAAAPKVVTNVHPYTPGQGTVTAVMPTPGSAAAGGTGEPVQRLEIKMDSGQVQYVDVASRESKDFAKGTRVQLTQDKLIRKM